jgi:hypothetical protein
MCGSHAHRGDALMPISPSRPHDNRPCRRYAAYMYAKQTASQAGSEAHGLSAGLVTHIAPRNAGTERRTRSALLCSFRVYLGP